jgi:hypothetical protein
MPSCQKLRDSISTPLENIISKFPSQYNKSKIKLDLKAPENRAPVHLQRHNNKRLKQKLKDKDQWYFFSGSTHPTFYSNLFIFPKNEANLSISNINENMPSSLGHK